MKSEFFYLCHLLFENNLFCHLLNFGEGANYNTLNFISASTKLKLERVLRSVNDVLISAHSIRPLSIILFSFMNRGFITFLIRLGK